MFFIIYDFILDFKHYYYVRKTALPVLHFWPHLVVYLDTPVHKCMENIRKRGNVSAYFLNLVELAKKKEFVSYVIILLALLNRLGDGAYVRS